MSSFRNACLILLLCVFALSLDAQVLLPTVKPSPKVNPERLKRIDALLNDFVQQNKIMGAVSLLVKDGQIVH